MSSTTTTPKSPSPQEEQYLARQLKDILLGEDRNEINRLKNIMDDPSLLSDKIAPVVDQRINLLKQKFPKEFQTAVNSIVEKKMRESQSELLDIIYPVIGKMISKYIVLQFQELKDGIDHRVRNFFSLKQQIKRLKYMFTGVQDSDLLISELDNSKIEEVYIIERETGLLMGSTSRQGSIDKDILAGMFTAIKSFVEDAFQKEKEELEMIEYGSYRIFIQNVHSYYIAVILNGSLSQQQRKDLSARILDFMLEIKDYKQIKEENRNQYLSKKLDEYFDN